MITNIHLHPSQQAQLKEAELSQVKDLATKQFPYPLAVSFQNFFQAAKKGDKTLALIVFANDVTTTVFQFLSLILASEYIESSSPRSLRMFQAIENMTYRPGPGKWLAFLREFYNYQKQVPDDLGKFHHILNFIEIHEINKKSALIKVEENNGSSPSKKLGMLELMVNLRNNFAHSKGYDNKTLGKIALAVEQIVNLLLADLDFFYQYKLMLSPTEMGNPVFLMGAELPEIKETPGKSILVVKNEDIGVKLFPMFINDRIAKGKTQDVFLLEAMDNKKVLYASNRHISEKRTDKDSLALELAEALKKIHVEPEVLDASKVSLEQFHNRTLQHTELMLAEYELNGKYNEDVYVLPGGYSKIINAFFSSGKKIIFLRDDQGSGKSAFCAHLANQYIKNNNSDRLNFLLDARHLDELGEVPMLFDDFIKNKLGVAGDLYGLLNSLQKKHPGKSITITIDNLNEYYLKGVDQSILMERLFDFIYRFKDINTLQIIAIARPEYFKKSIEKYAQQFKDKKIEELTFMPQSDNQGRPLITTLLSALSNAELEQIWKNYGTHYTGYTPKTSWEGLNDRLKEHCSKPLIMLYLLKEYDNKTIPGKLSIDDIKSQYIQGILKNKPYQEALFDLIKQMKKDKCPYLLTKTMDSKQLRKINDTSKDIKTALPYNHGYRALTEMQLIREEKVRKDNLTGKKITLNSEMSMDIVLKKFQKDNKKRFFRFTIIILVISALVICILSFFLYNHHLQNAHSTLIPVFSVIFNQIFTPEINVGGEVISIMADFFYANYAMKSIIGQLFLIGALVTSVMLLFLAFSSFVIKKLSDIQIKKRAFRNTKSFNVYEVFHFESLSSMIGRKLMRFILILFGTGIIVFLLFRLKNPESEQLMTAYFLLAVIIALAIMVFLATLFFKAILEENNFMEYLRKSFFVLLKPNLIGLYIFSAGFFLILYFSDTYINYTQKKVHDIYMSKFENQIKEIQSVAKQSDIEALVQRIEMQECSDPQNLICMLLDDIARGLRNEEIQLYANMPEINEILSTVSQIGKRLTKYWYYFVFGPAILMIILYSLMEIPIFFAKRKLVEAEGLTIA